MLKKNFVGGIISSAFPFVAVAIMMASCDETYDLNKLEGDIHLFENGLSVPVGSTDKFYLEDFMPESDILTVVDGKYAIKYSGDFETSLELPEMTLDPLTVGGEAILNFYESLTVVPEIKALLDYVDYTGGPIPSVPGVELIVPKAHAPIHEQVENFRYTITGLPKEIVNFQSASVKEGNMITLRLHAEGFPKTITHLTFDFEIKPPKQLKIHPVENDIWRDVDGFYHIEHDLPVMDGKLDDMVSFALDSISFFPALQPDSEGNISVDAELDFYGTIDINEPFDVEEWTPILDLNIQFTSTQLEVENVTACLEANVDPVETVQELGDLPDLLKDPEICLDLETVTMNMAIDNGAPIALEADLNFMSTFYDGTSSPLITTAAPIAIAANTVQNLYITNDQDKVGESGFTYISNLNELVYRVPRSIKVNAAAKVPATDLTVNLGEEYNVKIDYNLNVPISFGGDMTLSYNDEINDLGADLSQISDYVDCVELVGKVQSSLPIDLNMTLAPIDANGNEISDIQLSKIPTIKANATTQLNIEVSATPDALSKFDGIKFSLLGTAGNGGELNPMQYVQFSGVCLRLPNGITVMSE